LLWGSSLQAVYHSQPIKIYQIRGLAFDNCLDLRYAALGLARGTRNCHRNSLLLATLLMIPAWRRALICCVLLTLGLSLAGCGPQETPVATPTTAPTKVPVVSPTVAALPSRASPEPTLTVPWPTATELVPTHTPSPSATPTALPRTATPTSIPVPPTLDDTLRPSALTAVRRVSKLPSGIIPAAATRPPIPDTLSPDLPPTGDTETNPLTGLRVAAANLDRRPLGVKIANYPPDARPQSGLSFADVVFEYEVEYHLSRFAAIYWGSGPVAELGPIRSLRIVDSELMSIFQSVLVTSGGHPAVKTRITEGKEWAAGFRRIICPETPFLGEGGTMRRIPKSGRLYELTLYSDTTSLWDLVARRNINQRPNLEGMFAFSDSAPEGGSEATYLQVVYIAGSSEAEYRYDALSHTYGRFDLGQPTTDALTGKQIAPSNVLVFYVNHVDTDILVDQHNPSHPWYSLEIQLWGQGPARLFRDGRVYECQWLRQNPQQAGDRLVVVDAQGKQMPFHPGPTWIELVRLDAKIRID